MDSGFQQKPTCQTQNSPDVQSNATNVFLRIRTKIDQHFYINHLVKNMFQSVSSFVNNIYIIYININNILSCYVYLRFYNTRPSHTSIISPTNPKKATNNGPKRPSFRRFSDHFGPTFQASQVVLPLGYQQPLRHPAPQAPERGAAGAALVLRGGRVQAAEEGGHLQVFDQHIWQCRKQRFLNVFNQLFKTYLPIF